MNRVLPLALLAAVLLGGTGCSDEYDDLCEKMAECGLFTTADECLVSVRPYEFGEACWELLENASCSDHQDRSYWAQCWPTRCTGEWNLCQGDDMVVCDGGRELTFDCQRGCESEGHSYADSCGLVSPESGETEENDKCWCWIYE